MARNSNIQLGDLVRDRITGFEGVAVCEARWLNGCVRFTVQPRTLTKEGTVKTSEGFDVEQLEKIEHQVVEVMTPTGGPMPEPSRF